MIATGQTYKQHCKCLTYHGLPLEGFVVLNRISQADFSVFRLQCRGNQIFVKICHEGNPGLSIFQLERSGSSAQMRHLETGATQIPELKMIHLTGRNPIHAFTRDNHF